MKRIYNKLVRDNVPQVCEAAGFKTVHRNLKGDKDFLSALLNKLVEEAEEVRGNPVIDELADVLEVLKHISLMLGYSQQKLDASRIAKNNKLGSFKKRIFLVSTDK